MHGTVLVKKERLQKVTWIFCKGYSQEEADCQQSQSLYVHTVRDHAPDHLNAADKYAL